MKIKFKEAVTVQDANGKKYSINEIVEVENEMAEYYIKQGLAEKAEVKSETKKPNDN